MDNYEHMEKWINKKGEVKMKFYVGDKGLDKTWQQDFEKEVPCAYCKNNARIAFVVKEEFDPNNRQELVCDLYDNMKDGKLWPHDCIAVAVYFCEKCLETTARYNQA